MTTNNIHEPYTKRMREHIDRVFDKYEWLGTSLNHLDTDERERLTAYRSEFLDHVKNRRTGRGVCAHPRRARGVPPSPTPVCYVNLN